MEITLTDLSHRSNSYTLTVTVLYVERLPPYFDSEWVDTQPVQLHFKDEQVEYTFPPVRDINDDEVTIQVNMDEIDQIAVWDESSAKLIFDLIEGTKAGLISVPVVLSDGMFVAEYSLSVNVNNAPPYFDEWVNNQTVQLYFNGEQVEYTFPPIRDMNNDEVTIDVRMGEIGEIAVWDES